jgi:type IV pilus assembly protein PilE
MKRADLSLGFTLIELVAVLAVTGILWAIATPLYQDILIRARRLEAQTALLDLANRMEQYYGQHHTYHSASIGSGSTQDLLTSSITPHGWYQLSIVNAHHNFFILKATPLGAQATQDTLCQSLLFNESGTKNITAGPSGLPLGHAHQCWP